MDLTLYNLKQNNEEAFQEIKEKMIELKSICGKYDIPMFMSLAIANNDGSTEYLNDMVDPTLLGVNLYDDHIHEHLKILKGFTAVSKDVPPEVEMLDFTEAIGEVSQVIDDTAGAFENIEIEG